MNTNYKSLKAIGCTLALALALGAGTVHAWSMPKMFSLDNTWPFKDKDKPQEGTPIRMVCTWTDTVMTQAGQKPQRGFGGRIIFYDKEAKKPILVEGQLIVYAFDETNRDITDNKPTRRYVFPADQIPAHMSKCDMGASYSFWLPWDEAGGPKTTVSLISRFEPKGGAVVTSEQTKLNLPGKVAPPSATAGAPKPPKVPEGVSSKPARQTLQDLQAKRNAEQQAQLMSYETPTPVSGQPVATGSDQSETSPERHLYASTIPLPQNYQLPEPAALNASMQAAGYPAARQFQAPMNTMPIPMQPGQQYQQQPVQMMNQSQPYIGAQLPQHQRPAAAQPAAYPGVQAYATQPAQQNPMVGQIQQQAYQQPAIQPPMMQPPPIHPPQSNGQMWMQTPGAAPTTSTNYPASVQYR